MLYTKRADFQKIAEEFGIDQVTARIIRNRDVVGEEQIRNYLSGRLSDKISPSKLATGGMAMTSLGLALFCFLSESTSYVYIAGALFILGLGFGIFSAPNQNIIMSSVDAKSYGQAAAATGTMRLIGQSFSMGLAMMAISIYIGSAQITAEAHEQLTASLKMTFAVSAFFCIIGVYLSSIRNGRKKR